MSQIIASTYEIIGKIGAGGGGVVYLADHLRLGKRVVLKADKRNIKTREALLRREVDVLKELRHEYIPQVYDYFIEDGISYTVMDYVDGESLDRVREREGKFSQAQVISWAKQLLEALSYLHSPTHGDPPRGYVHSDIKPANIMLRPGGDICLIDFNISLAMGIENIVGKSEGYSSPEYYALEQQGMIPEPSAAAAIPEKADISDEVTEVSDEVTELSDDLTKLSDNAAGSSDEVTEILVNKTGLPDNSRAVTSQSSVSAGVSSVSQSYTSVKKIIPDARSDIYSVGATLYHLLSGRRPAKYADKVEPLSKKEFSPLLVDIITKAMAYEPENRFQTADEMLEALRGLWRNDPRTKRQKRLLAGGCILVCCGLAAGGIAVSAGLRQMERQSAGRVLASASAQALSKGNVSEAVDKALEALVESPGAFDIPYTPSAQLALTNALGVYDLSDSFRPDKVIELPSAPFRMRMSPDGNRLMLCYAYELAVYDISSGELLSCLPTLESAMCEAWFMDNDRIIYAGADGITAYDISGSSVIWQGDTATAIALSGDTSAAAAVNGTDGTVTFYDTATGSVLSSRELYGRHLNIPENDRFTDSGRDVLELNLDGSMCAVSLTGGYLGIMDIYNEENDLVIFDGSDYTRFDGKFLDNIFAFSAAGSSGSIFGMVDWVNAEYLGDMPGNSIYRLTVYDGELYITQNDTIVHMDTRTYEQTETAYTENQNINAFDISENYVISAVDRAVTIFARGTGILQTEGCEEAPDFVLVSDEYAVIASRSSPYVRILKMRDSSGTVVLKYDPRIAHSEARLSEDGQTVTLFDINGMIVLNANGTVRSETAFDEPEKIYDQQYLHDGDMLEVTYYSGRVVCFSAATGEMISETFADPPDESLDEVFETERYLITSPLHGTPTVLDKQTGRETAMLRGEDYMTYITELREYIIAQYISAEGVPYGVLMNGECEVIGEMPYLCDISGGQLIFDYPTGSIKKSSVYELSRLREMAGKYTD